MFRIEEHGSCRVRVRPDSTATMTALLASLPFESVAERWGDEVYFSVPFHSAIEQDARAEMHVGDVAFWPEGDVLAVFFGRTPSSVDDKPRAYSPCNTVGAIEGDLSGFKTVRQGARIRVSLE